MPFGRDRRLTQVIAAFAHERNYDGKAYKSRFDTAFDCWAIFEGALYEQVNQSTMARDDPDFVVAMRRFRLRLEDDDL
jgi:hypothetical protein